MKRPVRPSAPGGHGTARASGSSGSNPASAKRSVGSVSTSKRSAYPKSRTAAPVASPVRRSYGAGGSVWASLRRVSVEIHPGTAIAGVLIVTAVVLAPYVRPWLNQRAEIAAAHEHVAQLDKSIVELKQQQRQWNDPAYLQAQARDRFNMVFPGEVPYRMLQNNPTPASDSRAQAPQGVGSWTGMLWDSLRVADAGR